MHIAMFAQDFPPTTGGIQTYAHELAVRFARRAARFCVVAPAARDAGEFDRHCAFDVVRVKGPNDVFALTALPQLLRHSGALTFHTQWPSAAAALLLRNGGLPLSVVVAAHGRELLLSPWQRLPRAQRLYDRARRSALAGADRVFAVSRYTAELLEPLGVSRERISVQGNGTDPERFRPQPAYEVRARFARGDDFVFLSVARLVPRKGLDLVLRALARVRACGHGARLVVVGDGPERARLAALTTELGLGQWVHFAGRVAAAELPSWYAAADAFVLPARAEPPDVEGFGIAFLEASASELPVVGPDRGGPLDAIEHGVTGYCVDPMVVEALADAMARLASGRPAARALGRAGRARVLTGHTWDQVAGRLYAELEAVAGAG